MGLRLDNQARVRNSLLDAAESLFRERGLDDTRIEDIVEKARVSRQTFFNYFQSKERVLYELGLRWLKRQIEGSRPTAKRAGRGWSPLKELREGMRAQAVAIEKDREFMRLVYMRSGLMFSNDKPQVDDEERLKLSRRGFEAWATMIRQAQEAGEVRENVDPLQVAEMIFAIQMVTTRLWLLDYWRLNQRLHTRLIRALDILIVGLRK